MPRYVPSRRYPCHALDCFPFLVIFLSAPLGPDSSTQPSLLFCEHSCIFPQLAKMATTIDTAKVTGADIPADPPIKRSAHAHVTNGNGFSQPPQPLAPIRSSLKKKYRHVAAVHSKPRTSCLSHDSESSASFLGFRNLMVLVLSMSARSVAELDS